MLNEGHVVPGEHEISYAYLCRPPPKDQAQAPLYPPKALSAAFCRSIAQPGRYCDGNGLYLHVEPSRSRHWVQRLVIHRKACALGLGSFSLVPLAEARERALANRRVARSGGDPRPAARRAPGVPTFDEAVATVLAIHSAAWKAGGRNANSWQATLREYACPQLGGKGVDRITTADVMAVLLPIWTSKHATARKVRKRIGTVMKWAIAQGYRNDNPAGDALTAALPKRSAAVRHQRALPHGEVADAVTAVRASVAWAGLKLVFEFLVLRATRSAEARLATWNEIDLDARRGHCPQRGPRRGASTGYRCAAARSRSWTMRGGSASGGPVARRPGWCFRPSAARRSPTPGCQACCTSWVSGRCRMVSVRRFGTGHRSGRTIRGR